MFRSKFLNNFSIAIACVILAIFIYQKVRPQRQTTPETAARESSKSEPIQPRFTIPIFQFEEVLSITSDPAVPGSLLMYPTGIIQDKDGFVYVSDAGDEQIVVFDSAGRYINSFGGYGSGPGESQNLRFSALRDGEIHLFDPNLNRITRYRTSGELIGVIALRAGVGEMAFLCSELNRIVAIRYIRGRIDARNEDDYNYLRAIVTVLDSSQTEISSIESESVRIMAFGRRDRSPQHLYFAPFPSAAFSREHGIVMTTGASPVVTQYDLSGNLTRRIQLDLPSEPVTQADRIRTQEYVRDRLAHVPTPEPVRNIDRELLFAEKMAFWHDVILDEYGYIWLIRQLDFHALDQGLGRTCYVIHPNGEWLGTCYLPNASGRFCNGNYVTLVTDDETGERIPTVFQVLPAVEGIAYPVS